MAQIEHAGEQRSVERELLENTSSFNKSCLTLPSYRPHGGKAQRPHTHAAASHGGGTGTGLVCSVPEQEDTCGYLI